MFILMMQRNYELIVTLIETSFSLVNQIMKVKLFMALTKKDMINLVVSQYQNKCLSPEVN